jgi:chromosome segregation ATPase
MEIRIRTIDEFRSERVTVEVAPGQRAEIEIVDGEVSSREHLFTSDEVADAQASEAQLVSGPLQKRINEMEEKLVKERVRANAIQRQVQGYDEDRHTERERADRVTREHSMCAGKLELREKDADTFRRRAGELERRVKDLESDLANTQTQRDSLVKERDCLDRGRIELNQRMKTHGQVTAERLAKRGTRIIELENRVTELEEGRQADDKEIKTLQDQRDKALTRVGELDREVRIAQQSIEARDRLLGAATTKIDNAREILSSPEVNEARTNVVTTGGVRLSGAIGKALETLA